MYNWRLLLFAFFAVFQPIASYTERNLVDGRQQCCDHLSRDTGSLNGNYRLKLPIETRNLNYRTDIREVRRDDFRNERTVLINSAADALREARERQPSARVSRSTFHRMINKETRPELRIFRVRDTEISRDERNLARDNLSRARFTTTERRDVRNDENFDKHTRRDINQRESVRKMSKDSSEIFRNMRIESRRANDDRQHNRERMDLERRSSIVRNDLRQRRSVQSLDRLHREINENQRSFESTRATEKSKVRSEIRDIKYEAVRNEIRARERIDHDRQQVSRSLERRLDDRERFYRTNAVRNNRDNRETRNYVRTERRLESRDMREGIERFSPERTIQFRRIDVNMERNTERASPAERSRVSPIRSSMVEHVRVGLRLTRDVEHRETVNTARRMTSVRVQNRLDQNRRDRTNLNSRDRDIEYRRSTKGEQNTEDMLIFRTMSRERRDERRTTRSERENIRAFDTTRQHERRERRDVSDRARSLERERLNTRRTPHREVEREVNNERRFRERATSESSRLSSRNLAGRDMIRNSRSERINDDFRPRNMERQLFDNRIKLAREVTQNHMNKMEQNEVKGNNWQYLMYTMQGIYLCAIFLPILMGKEGTKKKTMSMNWGTSLQKLIKVD